MEILDHTVAIAAWLTPTLLVVIAWYMKREIETNERDHRKFFETGQTHEARITKVETDVEHIGQDLYLIKSERALKRDKEQ